MLALQTVLAFVVIIAIQALNFPPVSQRFPIPSRAVKRPLGDQGILLASDPGMPGYPTQRWLFPPNIVFSQVPPNETPSFPSTDEPNGISELDLPRQVGQVATPAPDGLADVNSLDLAPESLTDMGPPSGITERKSFIPLSDLQGKSQRPIGVPPPPMTAYDIFMWQPIQFPEDFMTGQTTGSPQDVSNQTPLPIPTKPPPVPQPTNPPSDPATPTDQIWLGPSGVLLPVSQLDSKIKSPKTFPIRPVLPPLSKGYAVPDIPFPINVANTNINKPKGIVPVSPLNMISRPGLIVPGFGSVQTSDPYINGYIAALNNFNKSPTPPDRVKENPDTGTVTLSNAYGDLWVLKKDGQRPYFERIRVSLPPPPSAFGTKETVRPSTSPKSDIIVIKKGSKVTPFSQKGVATIPPIPPVNFLNPIPGALLSQPCPLKPTPLPLTRPTPRPPTKVIQISGKGSAYPGPMNRITPYSYLMWSPSARSYLYSIPTASPISIPNNTPISRPTVTRVRQNQLSGGYWSPVQARSRPGLVMPSVDRPVAQPFISAPSEMFVPPQNSPIEVSASPISLPDASTAPPPPPPPSSSETSSVETSSLEVEPELSPVEAMKQETPIARSTEVGPQETDIPITTGGAPIPRPDSSRYRSYVFRYDYNSPDTPGDRISRVIPVDIRNPGLEQDVLSRTPFKFHRAVSYLFREGGLSNPNEGTTEYTSPASSSENPPVATSMELTSSSEDSNNIIVLDDTIDRESSRKK